MFVTEPAEYGERHAGTLADGLKDPEACFLVNKAALPRVAAGGFSGNACITFGGIIVSPRLDGPGTKVLAVLSGRPGARGCGPHAISEREALLAQGFNLTDDLEAQERPTFFGFGCRVLHSPAVYGLCKTTPIKRFCGVALPALGAPERWRTPVPKMLVNCGDIPATRS